MLQVIMWGEFIIAQPASLGEVAQEVLLSVKQTLEMRSVDV